MKLAAPAWCVFGKGAGAHRGCLAPAAAVPAQASSCWQSGHARMAARADTCFVAAPQHQQQPGVRLKQLAALQLSCSAHQDSTVSTSWSNHEEMRMMPCICGDEFSCANHISRDVPALGASVAQIGPAPYPADRSAELAAYHAGMVAGAAAVTPPQQHFEHAAENERPPLPSRSEGPLGPAVGRVWAASAVLLHT